MNNDNNNMKKKMHWKMPCVKRGNKKLTFFNAMSGLCTKTCQLHAVFSQFHSGEQRKADGLRERSSKYVTQLLKTFPPTKSFLGVAKHMKIKSKWKGRCMNGGCQVMAVGSTASREG